MGRFRLAPTATLLVLSPSLQRTHFSFAAEAAPAAAEQTAAQVPVGLLVTELAVIEPTKAGVVPKEGARDVASRPFSPPREPRCSCLSTSPRCSLPDRSRS